MIRPPPISTLFPYTPLFRSLFPLSPPAAGLACPDAQHFPAPETAVAGSPGTVAESSADWLLVARPSGRQTGGSRITATPSICVGSFSDSAGRGSSPSASTTWAGRNDTLGSVLPPLPVAPAVPPAPSSRDSFRSRWCPSADSRDPRRPDACAVLSPLASGPVSPVSVLLGGPGNSSLPLAFSARPLQKRTKLRHQRIHVDRPGSR